MQSQAQPRGDLPGACVVVAFVQTQPLRSGLGWFGPTHDDARQGLFQQQVVVTIGSGHRHPDWYAGCLRDHAALDPALASIRRVGPAFFPPPWPTAPWSCYRPRSDTTNPTLRVRRIPPAAPATTRSRLLPPPIPETDRARCCADRSPSRPAPPIGNRCAARRRSRPHSPGPPAAVGPRPTDACSCARVSGAPVAPTLRPEVGSRAFSSSSAFADTTGASSSTLFSG